MLFCGAQDLVDALTERVLVQLTDDAAPPAAVNAERCAEVIAAASELMLGRLAGRYTDVGELIATPLLRRICVDICAYYLYSRRNKGDITNIRNRYDEALKELESISLGQTTPPEQTAAIAPTAGYHSNKRRDNRLFGPDVWERY